jgi:dipeptidyl aminopeptidase/acylaminoacyl peptidase
MMRRAKPSWRLLLCAFSAIAGSMKASGARGEEPVGLTLEWILRDPRWIGSLPEEFRWTSDSRKVLFRWNPEGLPRAPLYSLDLEGSLRPLAPAEAALVPSEEGSWDLEQKRRAFEREGDLFLEENGPDGSSRVTRITDTRASETHPQWALGGKLLTFERDGNLFSLSIPGGTLVQLTDFRSEEPPPAAGPAAPSGAGGGDFYRGHEAELFAVIRERARRLAEAARADLALAAARPRPGPHWVGKGQPEEPSLSPDGRYVAFRLRQKTREVKPPRVPVLITESGEPEEVEAGTRALADDDQFKLGVIDLQSAPPGGVRWVDPARIPGIDEDPLAEVRRENGLPPRPPGHRPLVFHRAEWEPEGHRAIVQCYSVDQKDRWILLLDAERAAVVCLDRQHDQAWIGGPGVGSDGAPGVLGWLEAGRIWFVSEAPSGFAQLYSLEVETARRSSLTEGRFEVHDPFLSPDHRWLYFHSSEGDPAERHFYRMAAGGGPRERLTDRPGWNRARPSPDGRQLAFLHSRVDCPPELYLKRCEPGAESKQATRCASDEFLAQHWIRPERVEIPAGDGAAIPARLFSPSGGGRNGPAVIFVHGAGYLQEIREAWPFYFREYLFHNLLARRGYTVLELDYRGSAGYGRTWRTGIFRHMGGRDLDDHLDAARWLATERQVDPKAIGIYGGSYGGFLALMALFRAPQVFGCGAALRPVADWTQYHHQYVSRILHTPDLDPLAYRRSSPIHFAQGLERPLLICHGMADTNVRFQDTARLVQKLIELGKENWEVAIYPAEGHAFEEPMSWLDEYRRILHLFETHLRRPRRRAEF